MTTAGSVAPAGRPGRPPPVGGPVLRALWRRGRRPSGDLAPSARAETQPRATRAGLVLVAISMLIGLVRSASVAIAAGADTGTLEGVRAMVRERFPRVRQLSTAELAAWMADPARAAPVLLDVRAEEEFEVSHLRGARRVDPGCAAAELVSTLPPGGQVVVYCSVGYRSSRCANRLIEVGFTDVANLDGSIFQWANEGRPVERDGEVVHAVHPYDRVWGSLLRPELRAWSAPRAR